MGQHSVIIKSFLIVLSLIVGLNSSAQARYYEPTMGRFISPDTIVPNANDPQSLNRYSYVRNNPVVYIDPSGHFPFLVPIIAGAVIGAISSGAQSDWNSNQMWRGAFIGGLAGAVGAGVSGLVGGGINGAVTGGMASGATAGGVSATYNNGDILNGMFTGMVVGGIGGGLFGEIGNYYGDSWRMSRIFLQGTIGGGLTKLQGGKFSQGFVLAGGSALAMKGWQAARNWTVKSQLKGTYPTRYNKWGEAVVAGTRYGRGEGKNGLGLDLMDSHDANPNRLGPIRYDINSELGQFVNHVGAVHDLLNGWNYGANGDVMPSNIGFKTAFGIWSAAAMPPAAAYTAVAESARFYQPYFTLDQSR